MSGPASKKQEASTPDFVGVREDSTTRNVISSPVNVNSPLWEPYRAASYLVYDYDAPSDGKDHTNFRKGTDCKIADHKFRASGSHQLDVELLTATLRDKVVDPEKVSGRLYLVDLRRETHVFFDGRAVSWYADNDFGNVGQPLPWIEADEAAQLAKIKAVPTTQVFSFTKAKTPKEDNRNQNRVTPTGFSGISVAEAKTEAMVMRDLRIDCEVSYVRLPVTDHCAPTAGALIQLLELWTQVRPNDWVHYHCHGGDGRTTTFLALYDMLCWARSDRNLPDVTDFAKRQCELFDYCLIPDGCGGAGECTKAARDWKYSLAVERWLVLKAFCDQLAGNLGRYLPWGSYLDTSTGVQVMLSATSSTGKKNSSIDITDLLAGDIIINNNGDLQRTSNIPTPEQIAIYDARKQQKGLGDLVPNGSFLESSDLDSVKVVLSGDCKKIDGNSIRSQIDVSKQNLDLVGLANIDGVLTPVTFDDTRRARYLRAQVTGIVVRHKDVIDAIQSVNGDWPLPQHGGAGGTLTAINLDGPIIEISGYSGTYQGQTCVLELTFRTPSSSYGPYGDRTKGQNLVRFQYVGDAGSRVALFGSTVTIQSNQFGTTQVIGHLYVEFAPR